MAVKHKAVGSMAGLRKSLKSGGGNNSYLDRIGEDGITVRFLTEPTQWIEYWEHYDEDRKFYPCSDDCPGCDEGNRKSKRYLSAAVNTGDDNKVLKLALPLSVAGLLERRYEKYKTLLDRDYEITRSGTGLDTVYDAFPEAPTKMHLSRFEVPDLGAILDALDPNAAEDDDEDDDEDTRRRPVTKSRTPVKRGGTPQRRSSRVEDDEDNEDEIEDDDDAPTKRVRVPIKKSVARTPVKKAIAKPVTKTLRRR